MNNNTTRFSLCAALIAIGLTLAGLTIGWGISNVKSTDRFAIVKGLAERTVNANQAIWKISFSYSSDTLDDLYSGVAKAQDTVVKFLSNKGFPKENIQLEPVSITDNDSNSYSQNSKAKRFKASVSVVLTTGKVQDVVQSAQKTSDLVQSGVVINNSNVRYLYTNLNAIKPKMLDQATFNAEKAAETFAKNSHSHLNGIRRATQGLFSIKNADGSYGDSDPVKKIRVVSTIEYFLK